MKLTFIFTDSPDIATLRRDELYQTHFEFPDETLQLPDCRERILAIAQEVGQFTDAVLHISCKDLALKHYPVKLNQTRAGQLRHTWNVMLLGVERRDWSRSAHRDIKILLPTVSPVPEQWIRSHHRSRLFLSLSGWVKTE